jgi:hypothetical protein
MVIWGYAAASTHRSMPLEKDIRDWITRWNENPNPSWTKTADEILERLASYLHGILAQDARA